MQNDDLQYETYCMCMPIIQRGIEAELDALKASEPSFPHGTTWLDSHWLIHAIGSNAVDSVKWMMSQNVELNYVEDDGYSPLKTAAEHLPPGDCRIAQLLLQAGANPNYSTVQNPYRSAIHWAAAMDRADILKLFLDFGGKINWVLEDLGGYYTPLDFADGGGIDRRKVAYDFLRSQGGLTAEELGY